ncbi:HEAT repeat domain-containing protein [bacterium]|nr:HEAT repeat domain-containing protein [bacterium]
MKIFIRISLVILLLLAGVNSVLAADVQKSVRDALSRFGLDDNAFESDRQWMPDDTFLFPAMREALLSPLHARDLALKSGELALLELGDAKNFAEISGLMNCACPQLVYADIDSQIAHTPDPNTHPFEPLASALTLAEGYRKQSFDSLRPDERQALLLGIPLWFEDEDSPSDDSLKGALFRAFGIDPDTTQPVTSDSVLTLLARINRSALSASGYAFLRGVEEMANRNPVTPAPNPKKPLTVPGVEGEVLVFEDTPLGRFVIGGKGPNRYTEEFALILDLGGNDRYDARCASAVAGLRKSLGVVIDYDGNDIYADDGFLTQGCAIMGLAALIDLKGDDTYRGGCFSQSAAFCGVSWLYDGGGDDLYTAGWFSQGAAVCGAAFVSDCEGRDFFDDSGFGQAFASTFGFASLCEGEGNDVYRSGGLVRHEPLRPEDFRSLSQGFATGARPRGAGGIAVLRDISGNDFYDAEIYAQGVGYWYSLGALIDEAGNDSYSATQYSQGAGIHLACGVLEETSGDDRYAARFGPSQGAAHDLSVGILHDGYGDDQYAASGGQGMAITNSAAIFLDDAGNDLYSVSEPSVSHGGARPAREFGNLALFVDSEGHDVYTGTQGRDSALWTNDLFGYAIDVAYDSTRPREAAVEVALVPEDTTRPIEDLFKDASLWEVTDNREKVRRARLALKAIGSRAVKWVGENKLATNESLERRAVSELFKEFPDSAAPYIERALNQTHPEARRTAITLYSDLKYAPSAPLLMQKLSDPSYEILYPSILRALGDVGAQSAMETLSDFSAKGNERQRISAVVSLGKLKSPNGYAPLFHALQDSLYTVRSAAILALAEQPGSVVKELQARGRERDTRYLESLLLVTPLLGAKLKSKPEEKNSVKALAAFLKMYLEHPAPNVQGAALLGAAATMDDKSFDKLKSKYESTKDPILSARWRQALNLRKPH